jgi:hypothetical protein
MGAITDLLGGQVHVYFDNVPSSIEHIRAGRLRALAVTTATRSDILRDIPALSDFVTGYEASLLFGVGVPKKTPAGIIDKLNKDGPCRPRQAGAACRHWRNGAHRLASRFWKIYRGRNREMGQGGQVRRRQGGLTRRVSSGSKAAAK